MSYVPKIYRKPGGDEMVVASGGVITVESGGEIELQTGAILQVNASNLDVAELAYLDGLTPGAAVASKATVLDAYKTFRLGGFDTGAALTLAVRFAADLNFYNDGQLDIFSVFGASGSNLTSAYSAKCGRFRHVVNFTTIAHETYGLVGQVVAKDSTLTHLHAGLMGTFEGHTSGVVLNSAYGVGHAGVISRIGGHAAITATTPLAGFLAFNNQSGAIGGGNTAAFAASMASASYPWTIGLYIPTSAAVTGVSIGTCTTGINLSGTQTTGITIGSSVTTSIAAVTPATFTGVPAANGIIYANTTAVSTTPGSVRAIVGAAALAATTTSGTVVGVRGSLTATTAITGTVYAYGAQGKAILDGVNVTAGSGHICGLLAQISGSGMTATSGHIAALIVSGQSLPASSNLNMVYIETGGQNINSAIQFNCRSNFLFDINNFESCGIVAAAGTGSGSAGQAGGFAATRVLVVQVDGATAYIPLCSTNA